MSLAERLGVEPEGGVFVYFRCHACGFHMYMWVPVDGEEHTIRCLACDETHRARAELPKSFLS